VTRQFRSKLTYVQYGAYYGETVFSVCCLHWLHYLRMTSVELNSVMNDSNICTNFHEIRPKVRKLSENSQKSHHSLCFINEFGAI